MNTFILASVLFSTPTSGVFDQSLFARLKDSLSSIGYAVGRVYRLSETNPIQISASFRNATENLSLSLAMGQSANAAAKAEEIETFNSSSAERDRPESTPSGVPIGEHCWYRNEVDAASLKMVSDRYSLEARVVFKLDGGPEAIALRRERATAVCEHVARQLLADAMASDLDDNGHATSTAHLTGLETNKEGFVALSSWAQSKGVTVAFDAASACATFAFRAKSVKLCLASNKAIVNGRQMDLGGKFVLARGSKWFIPRAELEEAIDLG